MKTIKIIYTTLLLFACQIVYTQTVDNNFEKTNQGNLLRWTPENIDQYLSGVFDGYFIERSSDNTNYQRLNESAIRPAYFLDNNQPFKIDSLFQEYQNNKDQLLIDVASDIGLKEKLYKGFLILLDLEPWSIKRSGLVYIDRNIDVNIDYTYRVVFKSINTELQLSEVNSSECSINISSKNISGSDFTIEWVAALGAKNVSTGIIQLDQFNKHAVYKESNTGQENLFTYKGKINQSKRSELRIFQYDIFGNIGCQENLILETRDITPPSKPIKLKIQNPSNGKIDLSWTKEVIEDDFAGFNIYRSTKSTEQFDKINNELISKQTGSYSDTYTGKETWLFYYIEALDKQANASRSNTELVTLISHKSLSPPKNMQGNIDSLGKVKLSWTHSRDDVFFKIYCSIKADTSFTQVNRNLVKQTEFEYPLALNIDHKDYYFKVVTIDSDFQYSEFSETIKIVKPDTIAPIPAKIYTTQSGSNEQVLKWKLSSLDDDIKELQLYRKLKNEDQYSLQATLDSNETEYQILADSLAHYYYMVLIDNSKNISDISNTLFISASQTSVETSFLNENIKIVNGSVELNWEYNVKDNLLFEIYKKVNNANPELIAITSEYNYVDQEIITGDNYSYMILCKNSNNEFLSHSDPLEITN